MRSRIQACKVYLCRGYIQSPCLGNQGEPSGVPPGSLVQGLAVFVGFAGPRMRGSRGACFVVKDEEVAEEEVVVVLVHSESFVMTVLTVVAR